jgi:6-aminohexanoate-oligomer endohydrolase
MHWGEKCGSINDRLARITDSLAKRPRSTSSQLGTKEMPSDNTTISLVITNQKLGWDDLNRIAIQVHTSMGRAIQPFATASDGDVLFAMTTDEVDNPQLSAAQVALFASELAWDAILSSVPKADPQISTTPITIDPKVLDDFVGQYELGPGSRMTITRSGDKITAQSRNGGAYLSATSSNDLTPIGKDEFLISGFGHYWMRFNRDSRGRVTGLTINPGSWPIPAVKLSSK